MCDMYDKHKPVDANTPPASSNSCRVEPYIEAMAHSMIVEEIMNGSKVILYVNDRQ